MSFLHKRKKFFANKLHSDIFFMIFWASVIPVSIASVALFYLIFNITAEQIGIPEAIAYNIIPASQRVIGILLIAGPLSITVLLIVAHKISLRIVGPFDRIIRELDEHIEGKRKGAIVLRKDDKFEPLVKRINKLLK